MYTGSFPSVITTIKQQYNYGNGFTIIYPSNLSLPSLTSVDQIIYNTPGNYKWTVPSSGYYKLILAGSGGKTESDAQYYGGYTNRPANGIVVYTVKYFNKNDIYNIYVSGTSGYNSYFADKNNSYILMAGSAYTILTGYYDNTYYTYTSAKYTFNNYLPGSSFDISGTGSNATLYTNNLPTTITSATNGYNSSTNGFLIIQPIMNNITNNNLISPSKSINSALIITDVGIFNWTVPQTGKYTIILGGAGSSTNPGIVVYSTYRLRHNNLISVTLTNNGPSKIYHNTYNVNLLIAGGHSNLNTFTISQNPGNNTFSIPGKNSYDILGTSNNAIQYTGTLPSSITTVKNGYNNGIGFAIIYPPNLTTPSTITGSVSYMTQPMIFNKPGYYDWSVPNDDTYVIIAGGPSIDKAAMQYNNNGPGHGIVIYTQIYLNKYAALQITIGNSASITNNWRSVPEMTNPDNKTIIKMNNNNILVAGEGNGSVVPAYYYYINGRNATNLYNGRLAIGDGSSYDVNGANNNATIYKYKVDDSISTNTTGDGYNTGDGFVAIYSINNLPAALTPPTINNPKIFTPGVNNYTIVKSGTYTIIAASPGVTASPASTTSKGIVLMTNVTLNQNDIITVNIGASGTTSQINWNSNIVKQNFDNSTSTATSIYPFNNTVVSKSSTTLLTAGPLHIVKTDKANYTWSYTLSQLMPGGTTTTVSYSNATLNSADGSYDINGNPTQYTGTLPSSITGVTNGYNTSDGFAILYLNNPSSTPASSSYTPAPIIQNSIAPAPIIQNSIAPAPIMQNIVTPAPIMQNRVTPAPAPIMQNRVAPAPIMKNDHKGRHN